jgi:hypothetical protein
MPVRLHNHDEILTETREASAGEAAKALKLIMEDGFDWSDGLPIAAETTARYSKKKLGVVMKDPRHYTR